MRICVYILDAMISGTTTLAFHLAQGLRDAGHEVTTLTSTKSGKQTVRWTRPDGGAQWWHEAPNQTVAHRELVATFDTFDFIIVNDIASSTLDNGKFEPGYVNGLCYTTTPWTAVAHGNAYDAKHAPHFTDLIASARGFTGSLLGCTAPYRYPDHELFSKLQIINIRRPYQMVNDIDAPVPLSYGAGTIGRYSTGKNLHVLGLSLPYYIDPAHLELWGACINSVAPTPSFLTYSELMKDGLISVQEPTTPNKTSPWCVNSVIGSLAYYGGAYSDPMVPLSRLRVFVNLTSATFSAGTEYTTMEAVDAGCLLLAAPPMIDPGSALRYGALDYVEWAKTPKKAALQTQELDALSRRVLRALDVDSQDHTALAWFNRQVLAEEHNPVTIGRQIIEALGR